MTEMPNKISQYIAAQREGITTAAEAKIGRPLTSEERTGINNIGGGMMLEHVKISFSHPATTLETVLTDLAYFASQVKP